MNEQDCEENVRNNGVPRMLKCLGTEQVSGGMGYAPPLCASQVDPVALLEPTGKIQRRTHSPVT